MKSQKPASRPGQNHGGSKVWSRLLKTTVIVTGFLVLAFFGSLGSEQSPLGGIPVVSADAGYPATISATYNSSTGLLSASGTYSGAPCDDGRLVGYGLFINGANPGSTLPNTGVLDQTIHYLPDPCTAAGSWSDSHNIGADNTPTSVCIVIYDVKREDKNTEPHTKLVGAHDASTTTLNVDQALIPNDTYIKVDSEFMLVTAGGGTTTLTVVRGQLGSTAASHNNDKDVKFLQLKAGDLDYDSGDNSWEKDDGPGGVKKGFGPNDCVTPTVSVAQADVEIEKTGDATANPGGTIEYTLTVTNLGPDDAQQVQVVDTLPQEVTFVSSTPGSPTCEESGGVVTCDLGTVQPGDANKVTITIEVTVETDEPDICGESIRNSAVVSTSTSDDVDSNDSDDWDTDIDCVDILLEKTGGTTVSPGGQLVYTLTVTNSTDIDAASVEIADTLPSDVTFNQTETDNENISLDGATCSESAGVVTCSLGTVAANSSKSARIVVDVSVDAVCDSTTLTNSATVTTETTEANTVNNEDELETEVVCDPETNLVVSKTATDSVAPGGTVTYTITVTKETDVDAEDVVVTDTLPSDVSFVSAVPGSPTCEHAAGVVTCELGTLTDNDPVEIVITVEASEAPSSCGTLSNTVVVSTTTPETSMLDNDDQADTDLDCGWVTIIKACDPADDTGEFEILVDGQSLVPPVVVKCTAPDNEVEILLTSGSHTIDEVGANGTNLDQYEKDLSECGSDGEVDVIDNETRTCEITNVGLPDFEIEKTGPDAVDLGQSDAYVITVNNVGPGVAFAPFAVVDTLPAGLTDVSASGTDWTCDSPIAGPTAGGETLECTYDGPDLEPYVGSASFEVDFTAPTDSCDTIENTALLKFVLTGVAAHQDPVEDTHSMDVNGCDSDIGISKSGTSSVTINGNVQYTVNVTNNGSVAATNVVITDDLPNGLSNVSATWDEVPPDGATNCTVGGGNVVTCTIGTLEPGDQVRVSITARTNSCSNLSNQATVSWEDVVVGSDSNNSNTVNTTVRCGSIRIVKDTDPETAGINFAFTRDFGGGFSLEDDESITFGNLEPGSYLVTESDPSGIWNLTSIVCTNSGFGSAVSVTVTLGAGPADGGNVRINLRAGENVTCEFNNFDPGTSVTGGSDPTTTPSASPTPTLTPTPTATATPTQTAVPTATSLTADEQVARRLPSTGSGGGFGAGGATYVVGVLVALSLGAAFLLRGAGAWSRRR